MKGKYMGIFAKPKKVTTSASQSSMDEEKESAAKKQRLLETQGGAEGSELNAQQGKSVRKIFGA